VSQSILNDNDNYRASAKECFVQVFEDLLAEVDELQTEDDDFSADEMGLEEMLKEVAKNQQSLLWLKQT
jgi:hypothetical protein